MSRARAIQLSEQETNRRADEQDKRESDAGLLDGVEPSADLTNSAADGVTVRPSWTGALQAAQQPDAAATSNKSYTVSNGTNTIYYSIQ